MVVEQLLSVLADAVVRVTRNRDLAVGVAALAMVAIYPAVYAVRDGLAWFGALDAWEQLAVASLVGAPIAILAQSLTALRRITLPIAGLGVLAVGVLSISRSSLTVVGWVRETSGLKLFAAASLIPSVGALLLSTITDVSVSPLDVYTIGLPVVGATLLWIRYGAE